MAAQLTADDARQSLADHVAARGAELHRRYPRLGWRELTELLGNRDFVRYPCELAFAAAGLAPGEFAHAQPQGTRPEDGFRILVHPFFAAEPERVPWLVLYHLVVVNYGPFAAAEEAEAFGAAALGLGREDYYAGLCRMADALAGAAPAAEESLMGNPRAGGSFPDSSALPQAKKCPHFGKI